MLNNNWKNTIEQSLRGKSFQETYVHWCSQKSSAPVFDRPNKNFRFSRSQSCLIGANLKTSIGADSIIKALEAGCNAPSILLDSYDWESVLKGIYWEMIDAVLIPTSLDQVDKLKNYLANYKKSAHCTLSSKGLSKDEQQNYAGVISETWQDLHAEYIYLQYKSNDDIPHRIGDFLYALNNYKGVSTRLVVNWQIGEHIINELAALRALQACIKIWRNSLNEAPLIQIDAEVLQIDNNDSYRSIMQATAGTLIAKSGGAWRLLLSPVEKTERLNGATSKRLSFNIHHLLNEEGGIDKVDDPAAGSFLIEHLTFEMAQAGWEYFCSID